MAPTMQPHLAHLRRRPLHGLAICQTLCEPGTKPVGVACELHGHRLIFSIPKHARQCALALEKYQDKRGGCAQTSGRMQRQEGRNFCFTILLHESIQPAQGIRLENDKPHCQDRGPLGCDGVVRRVALRLRRLLIHLPCSTSPGGSTSIRLRSGGWGHTQHHCLAQSRTLDDRACASRRKDIDATGG